MPVIEEIIEVPVAEIAPPEGEPETPYLGESEAQPPITGPAGDNGVTTEVGDNGAAEVGDKMVTEVVDSGDIGATEAGDNGVMDAEAAGVLVVDPSQEQQHSDDDPKRVAGDSIPADEAAAKGPGIDAAPGHQDLEKLDYPTLPYHIPTKEEILSDIEARNKKEEEDNYPR